jgi:hypothetical protein
MSPLVKKEIRLLLPGCLAVLALEILSPWFLHNQDTDMVFVYAPVVCFLGMIVLAIDSFGREFSMNTFPLLMSQPVERRQIWWTKIIILLLASVVIFAAYFATCDLWLHEAIANVKSIWHINPELIRSDFRNSMLASVALLLVAATGGLWTSLLLRQTAAAFWITLLTPVGLFFAIGYVMSRFFHSGSDVVVIGVLYGAAGIYSLAGFWLARRLFRQVQDTAWLGGVINFSAWRYFEGGSPAVVSVRRRRPVAALLKKEFQLHGVSLICAGVVLALHIVALIVRAGYGNFHKESLVYGLTTIFWVFWLIIPLILGCTTVAEERKLAMADGQFCLPVSRRLQFAVKYIPILIFGTFLGGVMPVLVEGIANLMGAPNEMFFGLADFYNRENFEFGPGLPLSQISIAILAAAMVWAGFYASTLAKNFLQALGTAIVIGAAGSLFVLLHGLAMVLNVTIFGITLWSSALPTLIGILVVPIALLWLAWLNFSHNREGWRLWRRNVLGLVGALAVVAVSSAAIYNRAWEVFEPAEPPHGPAVFSVANQPVLSSGGGAGLQVRLPDGRIWLDCVAFPPYRGSWPDFWQQLWWSFTRPLPTSTGPEQFMPGSNWVSATVRYRQFWNPSGASPRPVVGYQDTVGIKADGTLWISSESKPVIWTGAKMIRYGDESSWQQIVRTYAGLLLLKKDGSLWQWDTNRVDWNHLESNWPTARTSQMHPIGTNAVWLEIFSRGNMGFAREKDGSVWSIDWNWRMEQRTNLDQVISRTFSGMPDGPMAYVAEDGTLWANDRYYDQDQKRMMGTGRFFRTGMVTNWLAVVVSWTGMVALKSDGSLWQWRWNYSQNSPLEAAKSPPKRLGIHHDWIGLTSVWGGGFPVTMAADGSLWLWPIGYPEFPWLKPPKQPAFLGNVFGKGY